MQWIILLAGLLMLVVLTRKFPASLPAHTEISAEGMAQCAEALRREGIQGYMRVTVPKNLRSRLKKELRFLQRAASSNDFPAAQELYQSRKVLQLEAEKMLRHDLSMVKLPYSRAHRPRVCFLIQEAIAHTDFALTGASLKEALEEWQSRLPMTADELDVLPVLLREALLEEMLVVAKRLKWDYNTQLGHQKKRLHQQMKDKRKQQAIGQDSQSVSFQEETPETEKRSDAALEANPAQQEQNRQTDQALRASRILLSLNTLNHIQWNKLLEDASIMHKVLQQDPVYRQMDAESRKYYRSCAAVIARRCQRTERAVCSAAISMCHSASSDSPASHVGYYLIDEGYSALLAHLQAWTPALRFRHFLQQHARLLFEAGSWMLLILLLGIGFFMGYAIIMLIPIALVFLYSTHQILLYLVHRKRKPRMIPRIALEHLSGNQQVLVVCPAVLSDSTHALSLVRHLAVMHEANPDPHLHFMLLGDFQDSLTATQHTDSQIIASVSHAINELCQSTRHSFYYFQRKRVCLPGEKTYHARERRHGALETLLCLLQGRKTKESFLFSSVPAPLLRGRYRYVIVLGSDTLLPPDTALQLIGAMMHPLQKRHVQDGSAHGICFLEPKLVLASHLLQTPFSRLLGNDFSKWSKSDAGVGIIDPEPYLDAVYGALPEGRFLSREWLEALLAGSAYAREIILFDGCPQTLRRSMTDLYRSTRSIWQLFPCLLPVFGYVRGRLSSTDRFRIRRTLFHSLIIPLKLLVMVYACFAGYHWLLIACMLLPESIPSFSIVSFRQLLAKLAVLPCSACIQLHAIFRTLYELVLHPQQLQSYSLPAESDNETPQPPMLFFAINMSFAGLFFVLSRLLGGAWVGVLPALVWAAFSFLLPALEHAEPSRQQLTAYMQEMLLRLAKQTLTFFEVAVTPASHALPPDFIYFEPEKGISHHTTPNDIGFYLCSLIAAAKMKLLSPTEAAVRICETLQTLEKLPTWHGLFYSSYDTSTLAPQTTCLSSAACGNLAVCLLACSQGIRALLPGLESPYHDLPARFNRLCASMEFEKMYDPEADLFWVELDAAKPSASSCHHSLFASEGQLLSFVSIMLRKVPLRHWKRLDRTHTPSGALYSPQGDMLSYMLPLLFLSPASETLLEHSCHRVLKMQLRHKLGGAFGLSKCLPFSAAPSPNSHLMAFGLKSLALKTDVGSNALAPYASMLCLSTDIKTAFRNLLRLQRLGLEGPLGLFESADFSAERTGEKSMVIVRGHNAQHQGMILCAICNTLCDGYITKLFSFLPQAEAYRLLLDEPACRKRLSSFVPFRLFLNKGE